MGMFGRYDAVKNVYDKFKDHALGPLSQEFEKDFFRMQDEDFPVQFVDLYDVITSSLTLKGALKRIQVNLAACSHDYWAVHGLKADYPKPLVNIQPTSNTGPWWEKGLKTKNN